MAAAAHPSELALDWESCVAIRSRFRRNVSWIQWPVSPAALDTSHAAGNEDGVPTDELDDVPKRPVCTKALELNADALQCMLESYNGSFVDIPLLQGEATLHTTCCANGVQVKCHIHNHTYIYISIQFHTLISSHVHGVN